MNNEVGAQPACPTERAPQRIPNRSTRRRYTNGKRRMRPGGVALADKPWAAPSFPQVYDIDKRGKVHGTT